MKQKKLIQVLGFKPKENTSGIFHKTYSKFRDEEHEKTMFEYFMKMPEIKEKHRLFSQKKEKFQLE